MVVCALFKYFSTVLSCVQYVSGYVDVLDRKWRAELEIILLDREKMHDDMQTFLTTQQSITTKEV